MNPEEHPEDSPRFMFVMGQLSGQLDGLTKAVDRLAEGQSKVNKDILDRVLALEKLGWQSQVRLGTIVAVLMAVAMTILNYAFKHLP